MVSKSRNANFFAERRHIEVIIRPGREEDGVPLAKLDPHIEDERLREALKDKRVWIAWENDHIVGWLRFSWFWSSIPFMDMLYILEKHRRQGIGQALVKEWEEAMEQQGCTQLLTSTQADEDGQHLYRRLGYQDAGCLLLPTQATELFFHKRIPNP